MYNAGTRIRRARSTTSFSLKEGTLTGESLEENMVGIGTITRYEVRFDNGQTRWLDKRIIEHI
jgi:hypothetical protein